MTDPRRLPFGAWPSPLRISALVAGSVRFADPRLDGRDACWLEGRPSSGGRQTLVRLRDGAAAPEDLTPPDVNVRDRVHEYGGAPYTVAGGVAWYSDFADTRLWRRDPDGSRKPITPVGPWRYADPVYDAARDRIVCVREDHTVDEPARVVNELVAIPAGGGDPVVLVSGADFYANPRLSPDGSRLAWIEWQHPNLPWDETSLLVGRLGADGSLVERVRVAGEPGESVIQPRWSPDGELFAVAERSGWWNLYRWDERADATSAAGATSATAAGATPATTAVGGSTAIAAAGRPGALVPLAPMEAELGSPQWVFGMSDWDFAGPGRIVATARAGGRNRLYLIATATGAVTEIPTPFTELDGVHGTDGFALVRAASPTQRYGIHRVSLPDGATVRVAGDAEPPVPPELASTGIPVEFPTSGGRTAHGILYPPHLPGVAGLDGELPPLVVTSHGGPTAGASTALSVTVQLYTSRGIAVLDVDYGGSTGYGRAYRKRLEGTWGVVDVDDCEAGARWLAQQGRVDPRRLAVTGGSASGYTTLCALAFRETFTAGVCHFGIGDLTTFVNETHKFESRYLDTLIGPYPERADRYRERSPLFHLDGMSAPALITQGLDDKVVPPTQARQIVETLRAKGLPVASIFFEGEDHGYRQAANVIRSFEAELSFLGQVFGFTPADAIEPVTVENLRR